MAADANGVVASADSGFTTLTPEREAKASDNVEDNATYGVGMIVSVDFDKDVKNKEAVAKGITFESDNGTVVKGHWFGNRPAGLPPRGVLEAGDEGHRPLPAEERGARPRRLRRRGPGRALHDRAIAGLDG